MLERTKHSADTFQYLVDKGIDNIDEIDEETLVELTATLINETPTKFLPNLGDITGELTTMVGKWMETSDDTLQEAIMAKLQDMLVNAYRNTIITKLANYHNEDQEAKLDTMRNEELEIASFDRQRI